MTKLMIPTILTSIILVAGMFMFSLATIDAELFPANADDTGISTYGVPPTPPPEGEDDDCDEQGDEDDDECDIRPPLLSG